MPKYVPTFVPQQPEELPRHLDQEFNRIADAVTPDRWDHSHVHITADYNAGEAPYIFANATTGNIIVYIPAPFDEMIINVKKVDSSSNTVTINGGGNNIDGAATYVISTQYVSITIYWDKEESSWWIV